MSSYEGIFIIDPDVQADASKGIVTGLQELVTKNGGRVEGIQDWGKKRLAYMIKKKQEGQYVLLNFQMDSRLAKKIEQNLKLNDNLLRYMIINKDEK